MGIAFLFPELLLLLVPLLVLYWWRGRAPALGGAVRIAVLVVVALVAAIPLAPVGSEFQLRAWEILRSIPVGETRSYSWMAERLGDPGARRAVGRANGVNMMSIIIPCHRVIRADGTLCGYGGGLWRKKWLLEHEKKVMSGM